MSQIKKIGKRMEITPTPERLGKLIPAENRDEAVTLGQLNDYGVSGTCKVYRAILAQSGTSAPTAIVLENTLGAITYAYAGVGSYTINSSALFTTNKTWFMHANQADAATINGISSSSQLSLTTLSDIATVSNNMIFNLAIEIRVYN